MPAPGEWRGSKERRFVGKREQRLDIGAARVGDQDRQLVNDFFTRRLHAGHEIPDGGVKPEHGTNGFLGKDPEPVSPPHVPQFVREHCPLNGIGQGPQRFGQQHHRATDAECHGLADHRHVSDLGTRRGQRGQLTMAVGDVGSAARCAQPPQAEQPASQPEQTHESASDEDDADRCGPGSLPALREE